MKVDYWKQMITEVPSDGDLFCSNFANFANKANLKYK